MNQSVAEMFDASKIQPSTIAFAGTGSTGGAGK